MGEMDLEARGAPELLEDIEVRPGDLQLLLPGSKLPDLTSQNRLAHVFRWW